MPDSEGWVRVCINECSVKGRVQLKNEGAAYAVCTTLDMVVKIFRTMADRDRLWGWLLWPAGHGLMI